jgi:hypothetical protein
MAGCGESGAEAARTTGMLELDGRLFLTERPAVQPRRRWSRRTRWVVGVSAITLFVAASGWLIADQVTQRDDYDRAHASLVTTQQRTDTASARLEVLRSDLRVLKTQLGSDTTALNQDSSQLLGARTSLSAAQTHVGEQASLITSLQTCLGGVEQALNQLSVGKQPGAIAALNSVSSSCATAEASSG